MPRFMKKTRATPSRPCLRTSLIGAFCRSTTPSVLSSLKTGDSDILRRMTNAATVTTTDEKNTSRQPQVMTSSSGHSWTSIQITAPSSRSGRGADEDERGVATASAFGRRFGEKHDAACLFGARAKALQDTQNHEQDRRQQPHLVVGGQQSDEEGGDAHQQQRRHEDPLASHPIAEVREEQAAKRSRGEPHRIGAERRDESDGR